jgi:hypothetical protein
MNSGLTRSLCIAEHPLRRAEGVRIVTMRAWLYEELEQWRVRQIELGLLAGSDDDFIILGAAPAGQCTIEQQHNFIRDMKAFGRVAAERDATMAS